MTTENYGEPWVKSDENEQGDTYIRMTGICGGSDVIIPHQWLTVPTITTAALVRRILACVNGTVGIPTQDLEASASLTISVDDVLQDAVSAMADASFYRKNYTRALDLIKEYVASARSDAAYKAFLTFLDEPEDGV